MFDPRRTSSLDTAAKGFVTALVLAVGGSASARDVSTAIDVQQFKPSTGAEDLWNVQAAGVAKHRAYFLSATLNFADHPLSLIDPVTGDPVQQVVRSQTTLDLMGSMGLFDRFEVGLAFPLSIASRQATPISESNLDTGFVGAGAGDLRLTPKAFLAEVRGTRFAAAATLVLPTGNATTFLGDGSVGVQPRVLADHDFGRIQVAGNLGLNFRRSDRFLNLTVGNEFTYAFGAAFPFLLQGEHLAVLANVVGAVGLEESQFEELPLEVLAGLRWRINDTWVASAGMGRRVGRGYGSPDFRAVAGLGWNGEWKTPAGGPPPPPPPPRPPPVPPPPPPDADGDGIPDAVDRCPNLPEDKDGFQDDDGCPDPDNDKDGIPDAVDRCPLDPETVNGFQDEDGCPDEKPAPVDTDGDGLTDDVDKCPNEPEDKDGFQDEDGCPDPDNDRDGVPDATDRCPYEAETINGFQDEDGCPDKGKPKVLVMGDKIVILEKVYFATDKDVILKRSFNLLTQVASTLKANTQLRKVRIEGHTDDKGKAAKNLDLSERRAKTVKEYLLKAGIAPERLESVGYGQTKPVDTNKTAAGRENNRRVEFIVVEQAPVER